MKLLAITGARPQFIKHYGFSRIIPQKHEVILVHTGQHYDYNVNKIFFDELDIKPPDYNLNVGSGTHGYQTAEMIKKIEDILFDEKPDMVVLYGDTNSTMAGAISASKLNIPIAHIEAGLREHDLSIPEEVNKVVVDHISTLLFAPSKIALDNLSREGLSNKSYYVGDITLDTVKEISNLCESSVLDKYGLEKDEYIFFTMHRQKNTDISYRIVNILNYLRDYNYEKKLIFPVHPRTKRIIMEYNYFDIINYNDNIVLLEPICYHDSLVLIKNSYKVVTDSGGVIKESFFLNVPVYIIDDTTEWVEVLDSGMGILVGNDMKKLDKLIRDEKIISNYKNEYGEKNIAEKILNIICDYYDKF